MQGGWASLWSLVWGEPLRVAVADGVIHASAGTCKVRLKMQQFPADSKRHVVELTDAYKISVSDFSV